MSNSSMSSVFRAMLTRDVTYLDFYGNTCMYCAGTEIQVRQVLKPGLPSICTTGKTKVETVGAFIGIFGEIAFDIERMQFQLIS